MRNFIEFYKGLTKHRDIIFLTTKNEIRQKYAGSIIGLFWLVLYPVILIILYSIIYLVIFKVRPVNLSVYDYVLYIFTGLIPFLGFAESLSTGSSSLSLNKSILLNTVYPSEFVPLRSVITSHVFTIVGLTIVCFIAIIMGKISFYMLIVPFVIILLILFVTGIVWVLSLASLIVKDIQQMLTFINMTLLIISPIAYTTDMVPDKLKIVIYANPLSYYVFCLHDLIVFKKLPPVYLLITIIIMSFVSFIIGYSIYKKAKSIFFDYA